MTMPTPEETRLERTYRRFGTRTPSCATCGETYPHALELHHIGEQAHHDDLSIICRNCHRKLSDAQVDRRTVTCSDDRSEMIGRYLYGLADLFRMIADTLTAFARELLGLSDDAEASP